MCVFRKHGEHKNLVTCTLMPAGSKKETELGYLFELGS